MDASLNLWENFVESIAQVLSQALTDKETEKLVSSFQALQQRLRQLSVENLRRLEQQAKEKAYSCKHHGTCVSNTLRAFIRSFVITYALKYALGFFPAVLTGKAFSSPRILIKIGGRDTISFSLFMSLFISSFKGMLCSLRAIRNVNDHWNSFIAGCFAGLSILLDTNKSRRIMIALYLSTRTTHFLSRWIWRTFVSKWFDRLGYHNPNAPHNHKHRHHKVDRHLQIDGAGSSNGVEDIRQIPDSADAIAIETAIDQQGRPVSTNATAATSNSPDKTRVSEILSVRGTTLAHPSPPRVHGADRNSHPTINIASSLTPPSFDISRTSPLPDRDLTEFEDVDDHRHTHHPMRKWIRQTSAVLVMMLSSSQILNAFVCEPDTLAKSYVSFLLTHGGIRDLQPTRAREYLNAFGSSINSTTVIPFSPAPEHPERLSFMERIPKGVPLEPLIKFQSFLDQHPQKYLLCSLQHPNYPHCYQSFLWAFKGEWTRALALYAPLNLIMTLIFRGKKSLKQPGRTALQVFTSTLRSSFFLACYVSAAWYTPCIFRSLRGRDEPWMFYVNGLIAGSMVLIEVPGRRLELALYCLPRALESLWNSLVKRGVVSNIKGGEVVYFCISTGVLMTLYQGDPGSIHEGYRKVMHRFFGIN